MKQFSASHPAANGQFPIALAVANRRESDFDFQNIVHAPIIASLKCFARFLRMAFFVGLRSLSFFPYLPPSSIPQK